MRFVWVLAALVLVSAVSSVSCAEPGTPTAPAEATAPIPEGESRGDSPGDSNATTGLTDPIEIAIDVRPLSDVNPIDLGSRGVVPVVLIGSEALSPLEVDRVSLRFGPAGGPGAAPMHDLAQDCVFQDHARDVDGQEPLDLVTHFRIADLAFGTADTEGCLEGTTLAGVPFVGCDHVQLRP